MKISNTILYFFLFIVAWSLFVWGAWDVSQAFTTTTVMPWVVQLINQSSEIVSFSLAAGLAVMGALVAVICAFVACLMVSILWHRIKAVFTKRS